MKKPISIIAILLFTSSVCPLLISDLSDELSMSQPLDQFIRHYEHIHYDRDNLMYHHWRVRRSTTTGDILMRLSFTAFGREFDLSLHPDTKFFHKSASFYDSNGQLSKSQIMSYLYAGHDINDPSVTVSGNLAFGVFDGKIKDDTEVYYIEPSDRYLNDSVAESHSIIYRVSDVDTSKLFRDHPEATPCGATTRTQQRTLASLMHSNGLHEQTQTNSGTRLHKRQSFDSNLIRCPLNIIADYKFYNSLTTSDETVTVRRAQAASLIRTFIAAGNDNFENQDFDDDGVIDGIQFSIFNLTVETTPPPDASPFSNDFLGAAAFLDEHSNENWNAFCLSYRFTYRDFAQGVLGLAFVAATGSRGGICDTIGSDSQTFNTGIVTLLNFNTRVSNAVAGLTFTHEAGHNFGSQHDPADDPRDCQPSNSNGGKYVMFDRANDGSLDNNHDFSPCSREMMLTQIRNRGQDSGNGCFTTAEDNCGNDILDEGEDCDCGLNFDSTTKLCNEDPCCNGTVCKLATDMDCSTTQGICCNDNCTFIEDDFVCREEGECSMSQTCSGFSAVCPVSEPRHSMSTIIMCLSDSGVTKFCLNGVCEGSICIPLGLDDCECTVEENQCHVCCVLANGMCESTITIAENNETARQLLPGGVGQILDVGLPCNDFNGYCTFFNTCQPINTNGTLKRITNDIFNSAAIQHVVQLVKKFWWSPIVAFLTVTIGLFLFVLGCHFILPRPHHMENRSKRRSNIRKLNRQVYNFEGLDNSTRL